jgi:uncharacterized protein YbjT (DUF2867 family)
MSEDLLAMGATGRLRPLVDALMARGHDVRVTARDPDAAHARALAARGVRVVRADLDDRESLRAAADGASVVLAAGSPHQAGPAGEARHGINAAEAAAAAGVEHFVFASGAGADRPTAVPVPVLESKRAVEQRIRELGLEHTILAPVYFMENAFNPWNVPALIADRFPLPLPSQRPLQQLAIEDLAAVATEVIERRREFAGERVELAGDELTGPQAAAAISDVTGRRFTFQPVPLDDLPPAMRSLFDWLNRHGTKVDLSAVRARFPSVGWHRFADWATTQAWPVAGIVGYPS